MDTILDSLNPSQREAVLHTEGPLLVLAGAGSGKTRVIVHRIAHLIETQGVSPHAILAMTFTNKAAAEMRERVARLISPEGVRGLSMSTFHATCLKILRLHIHHLGYHNTFVVYDSADQVALVKSCAESLLVNVDLYPAVQLAKRISQLKQRLTTPEQYAQNAPGFGPEAKLAGVYRLYQERLLTLQGVDFDDLIALVIRLFESVPEVLARYRRQFHYMMVDEYQDTNHAQYRLIQFLTSERRNLCVVGDDDQSIYAFRGADVGNILEFERDFPEAKVVLLGQNYRSTRSILAAATGVIENNRRRKSKTLWTENEAGAPVTWGRVNDEEEEGLFIREAIRTLRDTERRPLSDFCILYRTHAQSRVIEETLRSGGLPYSVFGGLRFYDRREIKDLVAYLRLIVAPEDAVSLRRIINVPVRGIGSVTVGRLLAFSESQSCSLYEAVGLASGRMACEGRGPFQLVEACGLSTAAKRATGAFYETMESLRAASTHAPGIASLIRAVIDAIHYLDAVRQEDETEPEKNSRIENVMELVSAAEKFEASLQGLSMTHAPGVTPARETLTLFLDQIALVAGSDEPTAGGRVEPGTGWVTLMTLHSAKGLEFPVVFLTGLEEGLFPHSRALTDVKELEEERRLFYVGMTRARERLYLMSAAQRTMYGAPHWNPPSRFIRELPADVVMPYHWESAGKSAGKSVDKSVEISRRPMRQTQPIPPMRSAVQGLASGSEETQAPAVSAAVSGAFRVGARVRHPLFGVGQVQRCDGAGAQARVTVTFAAVGTKKLSLEHAKLSHL